MSEAFPDMSDAFVIAAPAKTNLWLRILGKREDGYHEIHTRMVKLGLEDTVRLKWRDDDEVLMRCSDPALPAGEDNLVVKAVRALERHTDKVFSVSIDLEKHIPSGAGLGGGSSDAAAVLRALNEMASLHLPDSELAAVGATIGSDIPFFVYDRTCDCRGRGEIVEPVAAEDLPPSLPVLLVKPAFGIAAAWAYQRYAASAEYAGFLYDPQPGPWGEMANDLERPVFEKFPILGEMKSWLMGWPGVRASLLSGSGSTMLAVLEEGIDPTALRVEALARYGESTWAWAGRTI